MPKRDEYGLTPLWRELCDEVLRTDGMEGKAAYLKIRPNQSPKMAEVESSRILSRPECKKYLSMRKEEISQKTMLDAEYLRMRLADEMEADIIDLYEDDGSFKRLKDWPKIFRQGLVTEISFYDNDPGKPEKIKLKGRDKVYELFGRHADVAAFQDLPSVPAEISIMVVAPE